MTTYSAYVICGTPRSGSTLLCKMLAATGVAGRPHSYFREQDLSYWAEEWGMLQVKDTDSAAFDAAYLKAMQRHGDGGTGIFGIRIMWSNLADAGRRLDRVFGDSADVAERLQQAFGPVLFIHLSRADKLAQAVSLVRAEQSGLWHMASDGSVLEGGTAPAAVHYDPARIETLLDEIESDDKAWADFFAGRKITPLSLTYEGLTAAPQAALAGILTALGKDAAIARTISVPTAKMGDDTSRDWADRFRAGRVA